MPRFDEDRESFIRCIERRRRWAHRRDRLERRLRTPRLPLQARVYDAAFRSDAEAVAYFYALHNDHLPDFDQPKLINEKIRWQFLHHRNPLMSLAADKIAVRDYLAWKRAEIPAPALLAWGESEADLAATVLPRRYVLKSAFGSGQNHIEDGRGRTTRAGLAQMVRGWREWDQWRRTGELHYRPLQKRWLVEEYLPAGREKLEFKFYCLHGEPAFVTVITERNGRHYRRAVYDLDWTRLNLVAEGGGPAAEGEVPRPADLDLMLAEARRLSEDFMHVRVDFLKFDGRLRFSELTFATLAACQPFTPRASNRDLGAMMNLARAGDYLDRGTRIARRLGWPVDAEAAEAEGTRAAAGRRPVPRLHQIYGWFDAQPRNT